MKPKPMYVAVKGLFTENQRLLLLKKREWNFWDVPGGRIEFGESIETALKRELSEELPNITNIHIGELIDVRKKEAPLQDGTELFLVYYEIKANLPNTLELSDEHTDAKWFSEEEIKRLPNPFNKVYGNLFTKLLVK